LHGFPISPGRLLVEAGGARLVFARAARPSRWLRLSSCAPSLLPRVLWLVNFEGAIVYEYVEGEPLDSVVEEALALGRLGAARAAAFELGEALARLHSQLSDCPEGRFGLEELLRDRCRLAASAGLRWCPWKARGEYIAYSHWDPHLGQAIRGAQGIVFVDLDGEPGARVPPPPEYDVAVAARSIDYASALAQDRGAAPTLAGALALGYCRIRSLDPARLRASYAARLAYEYYFEVSRGTGLEWIPASALDAFEAGRDPVYRAVAEVARECARRY